MPTAVRSEGLASRDDVTDRKRAEEEVQRLVHLQTAVADLGLGASHHPA